MNFGEGERRRTHRTSSENLPKGAEITAFWRVLTQLPVANFYKLLSIVYNLVLTAYNNYDIIKPKRINAREKTLNISLRTKGE